MSNSMLRLGTLIVLVTGTLMALARPFDIGPVWWLDAGTALVLLGLVGTLVLRQQQTSSGERPAAPGAPR